MSLILLKKNALYPDLKALGLFLKKLIKKNEDCPNISQANNNNNQLALNTIRSILIINKFIDTKNFSLFGVSCRYKN